MADNANGQPQRKRARQACLACNARRVKCNVVEERPCANCKAGNVPCETYCYPHHLHVDFGDGLTTELQSREQTREAPSPVEAQAVRGAEHLDAGRRQQAEPGRGRGGACAGVSA